MPVEHTFFCGKCEKFEITKNVKCAAERCGASFIFIQVFVESINWVFDAGNKIYC